MGDKGLEAAATGTLSVLTDVCEKVHILVMDIREAWKGKNAFSTLIVVYAGPT